MSFLATVAADLYQKHGAALAEMAIVFPNKRPAIFFRQHLGQLLTQPMWSPDLFTIHEFIQESTSLLNADRLLCSSLLYQSYEEVAVEKSLELVGYERFYPLGEILLNDFTELESNVVVASDLYSTMAELAQLDQGFDYLTEEQRNYLQHFWKSFSVTRLSEQKERFLQLWRNLPEIFTRFRQKLINQGLATTGMIYRNLATNTHENTDFLMRWKQVIFVGFNALNRAELQFLQRWQQEGIALFYFDADEHYINDPLQEAGRFLRRNIQLFTNQLNTSNSIQRRTAPIQLIAAEGNAAQSRMLPALLKDIPGILEEPEQTAVLLGDENQLIPVLHALPNWIQQSNITMGYGLSQSPVYSLVQLLVRVQESFEQNNGAAIYFRTLVQLLQHPYFYQLPEAVQLAQEIQKKSILRLPPSTWVALQDQRLQLALKPVKHPVELLSTIRIVLEHQAKMPVEGGLATLEAQLMAATYTQLNRLEDLLGSLAQSYSLSFLGNILLQVLRSQSVPLEGEPLKGLQIMGLLESRALDFKHIILLNANEGIFPKKAAAPTFIPDSIRRAFGLSVLENQDAIFAYVFYRLLQRAETVHCLYSTSVDDRGMAEPSRFLAQLEFETDIPFIRKQVKLSVAPAAREPIVIPKDAAVLKTLRKYRSEHGILSPSAINTYLECRLRFYFQQVQMIREPDEVQENIDARTLGNLLHRAVEFLYAALANHKQNNVLEASDKEWLLQHADSAIQEAFGHELAGNRQHVTDYTGKLRVVEEVVRTYLNETIFADLRYAPFELVQQEYRIVYPITIRVNEEDWRIQVGGYIDRIDKKDGVYRIIDYKTGGDSKEFRSVDQLFERDRADRNKAALQTLLYAHLLQRKLEEPTHADPEWIRAHRGPVLVTAGLYDVRNMRKAGQEFNWRFNDTGNKVFLDEINIGPPLEQVIEKLQDTVKEILDPQQAFDQTTRPEKCLHCPYHTICGR